MARLTLVYHPDDKSYVNIGRRQRPMVVDDNLTMLMDLNSKGLCIDCPQLRGRELELFTRKFNLLTSDELRKALEIDSTEVFSVLNQCVQCVGCRRQVERIFCQLTVSEHPTLDPIIIKSSCVLSINEDKLKTPQALGTVLYRHHEVLNNLLENKLRNKTRCALHSLDAFRTKPFSETWREVWSLMTPSCRDELAVIQTKILQKVLDGYLKKHKFCTDCRAKIEKAYKILIGENTSKEKGYVPALFANIKKCYYDQHIHIVTNKVDFLDSLIRRAEPEVNGSYSKLRERHAKTLEIAQEEVLTCVGIIMNERLRRVYVTLREEERACQVLAAVGVHALCRSFDTYVEKKQGISNLELLYQEMSRAEKVKEHRREQKKLKKKKKKNEKKLQQCNGETCEHAPPCEEADVEGDIESDTCENDNEDDEQDEAVDVSEDVNIDETHDHDIYKCSEHNDQAFKTFSSTTDENEYLNETNSVTENTKQSKKTERKKKQKQKQKPTQKKNNNKQMQKQQKSFGRKCTNRIVSSDESCLLDINTADKCEDCLVPATVCPCENDVKDSGYGSEPNLSQTNSRMSSVVSSPEGSEISCSDGFCNHGANDLDDEQRYQLTTDCLNGTCDPFMCQDKCLNTTLSLEQMLEGYEYDESDDENCYIPQEVLLEYQCHYERVQQQRQQLRKTLRQNFERLCLQRGNCSPLTIIKK